MSFDGDSNAQDALSSSGNVIAAVAVSKAYTLYRRSAQRLLHLLFPWRMYPSFEALRGVSFGVKRGETVGIIGDNGAGKSTLLQIITGTVTPTAGEVTVNGRVAALLELGAGFEPDFTGRENIYLNGTILGLSRSQLDDRLQDIIAFSELEDFIDRPVKTYSSGMFMRLAFSVAAHVDADVLIIDEALSVGDARFTQKCMRFLSDFKQRGSILFVSHDLGAVAGLCDRALWLDHGRVRAEGEAGRICEQYVESLFREPDQIAAVPDLEPVLDERAPPSAMNAEFFPGGETIRLSDQATNTFIPPGFTTCSPFNREANHFGSGGASVVDAGLWDSSSGQQLTKVADGQEVDLRIVVHAEEAVEQPIFGFYIKDRLGQNLLGENTSVDNGPAVSIAANEYVSARFRFHWPALATGSYALTVAIADGSMEDHKQRHWMHDAVIFDVISSATRHGLVGLNISEAAIDRGSV
ncbi:MAG: ABC transporter ATP-binding protein [Rhodospirillaceae bacterium]|jgi:lipopolysaccharide transport system ATP-binding protein|nr:ABC transporter ATP-binding protein [Rhodospirillaceae bacterium]MBT5242281.1 ABC transporter ATP-binding protein [Rhodospirillaceae bacterium]MBT5566009.1 ABC transporter ATP-binding protein [Rhodospirillaceae bacterium]MBT6088571.1 ABC transporter ATP-binding protein [Rhodospirillaceae bacterium]MBT6961359.1 ABC transporter ATP-binding protein [Rhodospirillaceae bacterium]